MKHALSISLGSSKRDKSADIHLLGQPIRLERRGTNGDTQLAQQRFADLDGTVDAFGIGGIELNLHMNRQIYQFDAAKKLIRSVRQTPYTDGGGLKATLENQVVARLVAELGDKYQTGNVLLTAATDRYGMTRSFTDAGYNIIAGDLGFGLGIPYAIRSLKQIHRLSRLMLPFVTKLPISVLYPTGDKQEKIVPKFQDWYAWADVIAGDCLYIKQHMPDNLEGKVIVTNTTTARDMALFRARGVSHVLTTTPTFAGRSFGTNLLEAGLTAVFQKSRALTHAEVAQLVKKANLKPTLHTL